MITPFGADLSHRVQTCKVLVVGAGGIGCELLKNLALTGFRDIEVVDLDTIDLSNLNRQFLFRKEHISQSKSHVAAHIVKKMCPELNIKALNANIITDPMFGVEYFTRFDMVLNALDNLKARQHVNVMCLASNVPLLESGTAGLLGQAAVHLPRESECFDCLPHEQPKAFPVCTIRSTPSQFIHCVVWAKSYLFGQLFGVKEDSLDVEAETSDDIAELKDMKKESEVLSSYRSSITKDEFVSVVFNKVFHEDIHRLIAVPDRWKDRKLPTPLKYEDIDIKVEDLQDSTKVNREHEIWSIEKCVHVLTETCDKLRDRLEIAGSLEFDKDDDEIMDFVTAAACIRAIIFDIPYKTRFDTKKDAGNIIPAIATTNAIIAALVVLNALKVLSNKNSETRNVFLTYTNPKNILSSTRLSDAKLDCQICSVDYRLLKVDTKQFKFSDLIEKVVRKKFHLNGDISIVRSDGNLLYDFDFEDNLDKPLSSLKIRDATSISVTDDDDSIEGTKRTVTIFVNHSDGLIEPILNKSDPIEVLPSSCKPASAKRVHEEETEASSKKQRIELDDDFVIVE